MALFRNCRSSQFVNIFKVKLRPCSQASSLKFKSEENPNHIYRKTFTKSELIDHMVNSIIYNKDGVIVLNKPYGISIYNEPSNYRSDYKPKTFEILSLEDVFNDLALKLGVSNLKISKAPERFSSGILILTTDKDSEKKVLKSIRRCEGKTIPASYLVVTQYKPCKDENEARYGLQLENTTNQIKSSHLAEKWSYASQKRQETRSVHVNHKTLCSSNSGSLVRVKIKPTCKNALRIYMATKCLSPILGDDRFSQRIVKVNGVPVDLGSQNPQSRRPFKLTPEYLKALQLEDHESVIVPVHMHLHSFKFLFDKSNKELELKIDPPEWFIWTCEQLELDIRTVLNLNKGN